MQIFPDTYLLQPFFSHTFSALYSLAVEQRARYMPDESPTYFNDQEQRRLLTALRESEILRELAELLASSLDLNYILQILAKRSTEVCGVERCAVWLLEEDLNVLRPATYHMASQHLSSKKVKAADHIW